MYPETFRKLMENFSSLPSVGPKMAERLVLFLFRQDKEKIREFAGNLASLEKLKTCQRCFNVSEDELCQICKNKNRDQKIICAVEEPLDIIAIERTGCYRGLYHVIGGVILSAAKEQNNLKIPELLTRIKNEKIAEIIIATNPTTEGDATALYLKSKFKPLGVKVTRLARGLSTGGDIEYADELTLSEALTNRRELL